MILSSKPSIRLIKNLSQTLENYTDVPQTGNPYGVALPEQLNEYITQIRQHILDNPINDDNLPSH